MGVSDKPKEGHMTTDFDPQRYVHEHDDWADGDCTRCLRLDTWETPHA